MKLVLNLTLHMKVTEWSLRRGFLAEGITYIPCISLAWSRRALLKQNQKESYYRFMLNRLFKQYLLFCKNRILHKHRLVLDHDFFCIFIYMLKIT